MSASELLLHEYQLNQIIQDTIQPLITEYISIIEQITVENYDLSLSIFDNTYKRIVDTLSINQGFGAKNGAPKRLLITIIRSEFAKNETFSNDIQSKILEIQELINNNNNNEIINEESNSYASILQSQLLLLHQLLQQRAQHLDCIHPLSATNCLIVHSPLW